MLNFDARSGKRELFDDSAAKSHYFDPPANPHVH